MGATGLAGAASARAATRRTWGAAAGRLREGEGESGEILVRAPAVRERAGVAAGPEPGGGTHCFLAPTLQGCHIEG